MKYLTALIACSLLFFSCKKEYVPREISAVSIQEFKMDKSSIRSIYTSSDSILYYATSDGKIGAMTPDFKKLHEAVIKQDSIIPHFRSIASNGTHIYALAVENPALLYQYDKGKATLVYKEEHPKVFYDAMTFFDKDRGIAMGDPVENCFSIIITKDGGKTWTKVPCEKLPEVIEGEAAFAASNGNIATVGSHVWIVSGGKKSRVLHSPDYGETWTVVETPMMEGGAMTGIYAVDFLNKDVGVIVGGDWNKKDDITASKALTVDGGKTWQLTAVGKGPGYKSSVQYVPDTDGKEIFSTSTEGISYSNDGGASWKKVSDEGYYTIRFVNKNFAWLSGNNKIGKMSL